MIELNKIILGDCMDVMREIPDKSVDVIYIDPPYYKCKGDFDFVMTFAQWQELHEKLANGSRRILKDNGTLVLWGSDKKMAYQQIIFDKYFSLINSCVWRKTNGQGQKMSADILRGFAPISERFLLYDKGEDKSGLTMIMSSPDLFKGIKEYFDNEKEKSGLSNQEINSIMGTATTGGGLAVHFFGFTKNPDKTQFIFPTPEIYAKLQTTGYFRREYEDLRREYEDLRREYEDLRRYFNLKESSLRFDVIDFQIESHITGKYDHPTQKPFRLTCEILKTITPPHGVVFIPFSGSGTEAEACVKLGYKFLACEVDEYYHAASVKRLDEVRAQGVLF